MLQSTKTQYFYWIVTKKEKKQADFERKIVLSCWRFRFNLRIIKLFLFDF